jgi:hypothetical protein
MTTTSTTLWEGPAGGPTYCGHGRRWDTTCAYCRRTRGEPVPDHVRERTAHLASTCCRSCGRSAAERRDAVSRVGAAGYICSICLQDVCTIAVTHPGRGYNGQAAGGIFRDDAGKTGDLRPDAEVPRVGTQATPEAPGDSASNSGTSTPIFRDGRARRRGRPRVSLAAQQAKARERARSYRRRQRPPA